MNNWFKRLLGKPILGGDLTYEEARAHLEVQKSSLRVEMAQREDLAPEILYFLAEDESADVRCGIAANPATPHQADDLLSGDKDDEVRCALARKIARLVPDLDAEEQNLLHERTYSVLRKLVEDQLPRVRQIVSEEIKESTCVPHDIIDLLARDVELIVAAPVLEFSPLLDDDDLIDILDATETAGASKAVARRKKVSVPVADAVVATRNTTAIAALLANDNAQIREETLDWIIDEAAGEENLHAPLAHRKNLGLSAVRRIAGFVASSLVEILVTRNDLDEATANDIQERVTRRMEKEAEQGGGNEEESHVDAATLVEEKLKSDELDDEFVQAAIDEGKRAVVMHSLAALSGISLADLHKVVGSQSGKALTALTWKSGLSMRTALKIQTKIARVPSQSIVNAKNGFDYPMTKDEMEWHLEFFGT